MFSTPRYPESGMEEPKIRINMVDGVSSSHGPFQRKFQSPFINLAQFHGIMKISLSVQGSVNVYMLRMKMYVIPLLVKILSVVSSRELHSMCLNYVQGRIH